MVKSTIVKNKTNVCVAVNEVITRFAINRNFRKLLENDKLLEKFYKEVFKGLDIKEFVDYSMSKTAYEYDDLIWFQDRNRDLWLLKCIIDRNTQSPQKAIDDRLDGRPNFEKYGWQDQNEFIDIRNPSLLELFDFSIRSSLSRHENDLSAHRFGKLTTSESDQDFIERKVMKRDLSNIDEKRAHYFFPYQTGYFSDDTITAGIYRIWDSGIIEFDLTFRLGYKGRNQYGQDILSCNDVYFQNSPVYSKSSDQYQENSKYFKTNDDMRIFQNPAELEVFQSENAFSVQGNRNKYVNTYFAKLDLFPKAITFKNHKIISFKDLNYMVFCPGQLCQVRNFRDRTVYQPQNCMSWCNKTNKSITALYITFPAGSSDEDFVDFASKSGITANSFTCQIIGRWDTSH